MMAYQPYFRTEQALRETGSILRGMGDRRAMDAERKRRGLLEEKSLDIQQAGILAGQKKEELLMEVGERRNEQTLARQARLDTLAETNAADEKAWRNRQADIMEARAQKATAHETRLESKADAAAAREAYLDTPGRAEDLYRGYLGKSGMKPADITAEITRLKSDPQTGKVWSQMFSTLTTPRKVQEWSNELWKGISADEKNAGTVKEQQRFQEVEDMTNDMKNLDLTTEEGRTHLKKVERLAAANGYRIIRHQTLSTPDQWGKAYPQTVFSAVRDDTFRGIMNEALGTQYPKAKSGEVRQNKETGTWWQFNGTEWEEGDIQPVKK